MCARLYRVVEITVISGEMTWCSVAYGTFYLPE